MPLPGPRERIVNLEVIERLREKLVQTFEQAVEKTARAADEVAYAPRHLEHLIEFVRAIIRQRNRLAHAMTTVIDAKTAEQQERVLREANLAYLRDPARFIRPRSQLGLLQAWTELLFEATERVHRDDEYGKLYAEAAREKTSQDSEFAQGTARAAAARWRDA